MSAVALKAMSADLDSRDLILVPVDIAELTRPIEPYHKSVDLR